MIAFAGLGVRVAFVLLVQQAPLEGDAHQYHAGANLLVEGKGFIAALPYELTGRRVETAQHPPLYLLALAGPSAMGFRSQLAHQLWSTAIGTGTVVVVGLLGRRLAGARAGLIAAALAALHPGIWIFDGLLAAETLALFTTALALLAAYRLWALRSLGAAAALGIACALAALTRAESMLFLPLIALPFLLWARSTPFRRRIELVLLGSVAAAAVAAPWTYLNLTRFHHPPLATSTGFDLVLVQANCDAAYYGRTIGYFSPPCIPATPGDDETDDGRTLRRVATDYIRAHPQRVPLVVLARLGRAWGWYRPFEQLQIEAFVQGRNLRIARAALWAYYGLLAASVPGAMLLRRRKVPISPLVAVIAAVTVTVALTWGETRLRAPAELVLVVLAAVAADEAVRRWMASRPPAPPPAPIATSPAP